MLPPTDKLIYGVEIEDKFFKVGSSRMVPSSSNVGSSTASAYVMVEGDRHVACSGNLAAYASGAENVLVQDL